jgi:hypothetical protein
VVRGRDATAVGGGLLIAAAAAALALGPAARPGWHAVASPSSSPAAARARRAFVPACVQFRAPAPRLNARP